jgi:hypothetical protein
LRVPYRRGAESSDSPFLRLRIGIERRRHRVRNYGSREEAQALAREHGAKYIEN